jgi:tetratricopeptide (TPR) repeat protein
MTKAKLLIFLLALDICAAATACNQSPCNQSPCPSNQTSSAHVREQRSENTAQDNLNAAPGVADTAWGHIHRGQQLLSSGRNEEAAAEYEQAIRMGHDGQDTQMDLAEAFRRLGRNQEAAEQYRALIRRDNDDFRAHWALAQLLILKLKGYEEGLQEVTISKKLDDGGGDIGYVYDYYTAKAYDCMGRHVEALAHYKIFIEGESKNSSGSAELKEATQRVREIKNS